MNHEQKAADKQAPKGVEDAAKESWEQDAKTRKIPCNPHAYVYGFKAGATWQANQLPGVDECHNKANEL